GRGVHEVPRRRPRDGRAGGELMALDPDAIRARAEAARQAAASGTTGTPPNVDGLSIHDALDIFAESAEDVPALLDERDRLAATVDRVRALANNPDVVTVHMGGGNLVAQKKVIFPEYIRAAIEGTDS